MSNKKPNRRVAVVPDEKTALNKELAQADQTVLDAYWKRNISLTLGLLAVWFVVGYLLAIVFAPALNAYTFLGAPLGFWIAQNGAIYVFLLLIFIYALRMNQMDKEFGVEE